MKIGLIDVDGHRFPNLPLMKLSAWHKRYADSVEWYEPMFSGHMDIVYMSKVFTFTDDYQYNIDADKIIRGGTGYSILMTDGREVYNPGLDIPLTHEAEHMMPDYSIYGITDTAYGFLTRGCPRGCAFCHVAAKEGRRSVKVADITEFWTGQKNIVLCDPNILACGDCMELLEQVQSTGALIDFNQGLDIRMMTEEKAKAVERINTKELHFAWDRYEDKETILPMFKRFREISTANPHNLVVYVLCNYDTTIAQDLERIYTLRDMGYAPYVMLYNKSAIPDRSILKRMQRWVNNRFVFWSCERFDDYEG